MGYGFLLIKKTGLIYCESEREKRVSDNLPREFQAGYSYSVMPTMLLLLWQPYCGNSRIKGTCVEGIS